MNSASRSSCPSSEQRPPASAGHAPFRWVYSNNPFYIISAGLVCWGLHLSFNSGESGYQAGALLAGLLGYTLLLVFSGIVLVRRFQLWDDARSLLLLIVTMLLAISVSFDNALAASWNAAGFFVVGLIFASLTSELVLWATRVRLPAWYRAAYHVLLAVFFLYPLLLRGLISNPHGELLHLAVLGFPLALSAAAMLLIPAVRRGPAYVADNGTPWKWPWFPWPLFVFLAVGALARTFYLCISFGMHEIFGVYLLAPLLLAISVVVMEIGVVVKSRWAQRTALVLPLATLVVTLLDITAKSDQAYYLGKLSERLGMTPHFGLLLALIAFYAVASLRRVRYAQVALVMSLVGLVVMGPQTSSLDTLHAPWPAPLWLVAVVLLVQGILRAQSASLLAASAVALTALLLGHPALLFWPGEAVVPMHIGVLSVLAIGAWGKDELGRWLRSCGALLVLLVWAVTLLVVLPRGTGVELGVGLYCVAVAAGSFVYARWLDESPYLAVALLTSGACVLGVSLRGYVLLREVVVGLEYLLIGGLCFLVAITISLRKAGYFHLR